MAYLIDIVDPSRDSTQIPAGQQPLKIGRLQECGLRIEDPAISDFHAQIRSANNFYWLEDLQSENGTYVSNVKIKSKKLKDGDIISFGQSAKYQFKLMDAEKKKLEQGIESLPAAVKKSSSGFLPYLYQIDDVGDYLTKLSLDPATTAIGRSTENSLYIDHRTISRRHCEIRNENDQYAIYDLGSANGTKVNGVRIVSQRLSAGDLVQIGNLEFKFLFKEEKQDASMPIRTAPSIQYSEPAPAGSQTVRASVESKTKPPFLLFFILLMQLGLTGFLIFINFM